jgi:hypothetical protein
VREDKQGSTKEKRRVTEEKKEKVSTRTGCAKDFESVIEDVVVGRNESGKPWVLLGLCIASESSFAVQFVGQIGQTLIHQRLDLKHEGRRRRRRRMRRK